MHRYSFTVDAKLLQELGERLVGRPHIALAELIKNSYDADATLVELEFSAERIVVTDNGHGMSTSDFEKRWMRIGTTHKATATRTLALRREVTGSKGIGRLAAQLLARKISVSSVAVKNTSNLNDLDLEDEIFAPVNWDDAVVSGTLTEVSVQVEEMPPASLYAGGSRHGTRLVLTELASVWEAADFRRLAQEIWSLQSPFESDSTFSISLNTEYADVFNEFSEQMHAILEIWNGRITGRLRDVGFTPPADADVFTLPDILPRVGEDEAAGAAGAAGAVKTASAPSATSKKRPDRILEATMRFGDRAPTTVFWRIPNCDVNKLRFDIRVFDLQKRQPLGIKVDVARAYLRRFGGVGIYDGGFRLPYYGADIDWLNVERDNAARLTASSLLPAALNVRRGLLALPRNSNLFGQVFVSTSFENRESLRTNGSHPALTIQVTRDRLVDNRAYQQLRVMLRAPLDAYAMEKTKAAIADSAAKASRLTPGNASRHLEVLRSTLESARTAIPTETFQSLSTSLDSAVDDARRDEDRTREYGALLGALATAGITSLAYEHEVSKQLQRIETISRRLRRASALAEESPELKSVLDSSVTGLETWNRRAQDIRKMFAPLVSEEDRTTIDRFRARDIVEDVSDQVQVLARGTLIDYSRVSKSLRLPSANLPAWSAIVQNLLINSFNALQGAPAPEVRIDSYLDGRKAHLRVQDNGSGVDLSVADKYWEPFERGPSAASPVDNTLGGTGLGLTIVKMISEQIGVDIRFEKPTESFTTAVTMTWEHN